MKLITLILAAAGIAFAQQTPTLYWSATTGELTLSGTTAATIQQPAAPISRIYIDRITVYCSVACAATVSANGTAASTTAGAVTPNLPTPLSTTIPANFFTASNVGGGTIQGGILHVPAGSTGILCFATTCSNQVSVALPISGAAANNYTVSIASMSGVANITFFGRTGQ